MLQEKDNLKIFALGGLIEVGKNCYLIERNREIVIVDAGVKFLNFNYNLANAIIPNFDYLRENKEKVKGVFITHGHEDHIGAIPYLLEIIPGVPVYGSEFSLAILKQKMKNSARLETLSFHDETVVSTSEFRLQFFRVTHSIPGSFGITLETLSDNIRIILTGDFKFDWTEIGEKTDLAKLAEWGRKGVNLLLSDSTNAEVAGTTPSEMRVIKQLEKLIFQATGRVVITSFSSNVYRLKKIIEIAKKHNKRIVLLGSSLLKTMEAIKKASLWKIDNSIFIDTEGLKTFPREKLIVFCTGSQGEERAVLSRLANETYPDLRVRRGDLVILTSSPIMDNRYNLEAINNKLHQLGAKIYENSQGNLLHASGHACQEDLKLMLTLTKPAYFMPFHGDQRMLTSHGILAAEVGIPEQNILVCKNGEVITSQQDGERGTIFLKSGQLLPAEPDYIFNQRTIAGRVWEENVTLRKKMHEGGVVIVLLVLANKKDRAKTIDLPHIFTYGFMNIQKNKELVRNWKREILTMLKQLDNHQEERVVQEVRQLLALLTKRDWQGPTPLYLPIVEQEW